MLIHQMEKFQRAINSSNSIIIVEGKRDKKVLNKMGISNVIDISGKSLEKIIKMVSSEKPAAVAILTDFDKEGTRQFKLLTKNFHSEGINVDNTLRNFLKSRFNIQKIEELKFFTKLLDENLLAGYDKIFNKNKFFKRTNNKKVF